MPEPHELVIVGIPGDRDVDDKRVEVAFAPASVEPATEQDFENNPLLQRLQEYAASQNAPVVAICAKMEADMADMSDEDRGIFLEEMGQMRLHGVFADVELVGDLFVRLPIRQ